MKNQKLLLLSIFIVGLFISLCVHFALREGIVCWDEGGFLWDGYQVAKALAAADWSGFFRLSKSQFYYPFFQSWFLAFATLPFGYSVMSARLVSSLLLIPTLLLIWLLAKKINPKARWGGVIAISLMITSPLILFYFSTAMKEGLGTVLTLLAFLVYFWARGKANWLNFFWLSFLVLILTLTKYNYGIFVLVAFGAESLIWFFRKRDRQFWFSNLALYLPCAIVMAWWVSPPGYLKWFLDILQNKYDWTLKQTNTLGHLLYYPMEMAFSYIFSWLAFIICLIGFVYCLKNLKNYRYRVPAILFLGNFIMATLHFGNNQARYIFTSVPLFFLLGGLGFEELAAKLRKIHLTGYWLGIALSLFVLCGFIFIKDLISLPAMIKPTASHQVGATLFYEKNYYWAADERYDFRRGKWPNGALKNPPQKVDDIYEWIINSVDTREYVNLLSPINEINPGLMAIYLESYRAKNKLIYNGQIEYQIVFAVQEGSRFDSLGYRAFSKPTIDQSQQLNFNPDYQKVAEEEFPYLGVKASVFKKL
jgi:4-amino-4-deoxy-L-arabinose transferase-like glycosyltransferase